MGLARCNRNGLVALALLMLALPAAAQEELTVSKIYLGNVTFGSSAQAINVSATGNPMIRLADDPALGTRKELIFTLDTTADTARIQSVQQTIAFRPLLLNPSGGNIGLNTATATYPITAGGTVAPVTGYTYDLGAYLKKFLTIHAAELRVETLVAADVMATIGGRVLVAPTTQLTTDLGSGDTTMYVKHNNLAAYDRVRLEANGQVEFIAIGAGGCTGGSAPYTCASIGRNLDGSGANDWYAGDAVLNTGLTGDGYIDMYSDRSSRNLTGGQTHYGPTLVGNYRFGNTYNELTERWAIGNLRGLYGYTSDTYGAAFGDDSASWLKVDPTNGLRIGNGANVKVSITPAGTATFTGDGNGVTNINGANIATSSITANKMVLGPGGGYINQDPMLKDSTVWGAEVGSFTINTVSGAPAGNEVLRSNAGSQAYPMDLRYYAIDETKTYRFRFWAKGVGENGLLYGDLRQYADTGGTTCGGNGGRNPYGVGMSGVDVPSTWTEYSAKWGPGSPGEWVSGCTKFVRMDWLLNYTGTAGYIEIAYPRLEEMKGGELIVDGSITATDIAASTITGSQIAASTITSTNLSVSTLAAITANMGSLTAGNITIGAGGNYIWLNDAGDGGLAIGGSTKASAPFRVSAAGALAAVSGYFGDASSDVTLSASGITVGSTGTISAGGGDVSLTNTGLNLTTGSGSNNQVKWSDGSYIGSYGDVLYMFGDSYIQFESYGGTLYWDNHILETDSFSGDLGSNSARWHDLWLEDDIHHFGDYYWDSPPTTDWPDYPIVWSSSSKALYRKTSAISNAHCSTVEHIEVANGLVVDVGCVDPELYSPQVLKAEIGTLRQEVADLKAQVAALLALLGGKQ